MLEPKVEVKSEPQDPMQDSSVPNGAHFPESLTDLLEKTPQSRAVDTHIDYLPSVTQRNASANSSASVTVKSEGDPMQTMSSNSCASHTALPPPQDIKTEAPNADAANVSIKVEVKSEPDVKKEPESPQGKPGRPRNKKTFTKEELHTALWPALQKLFMQEGDAQAFRQPVDPILLGIPDYFTIIKRPMDLSTIRKNLDEGKYENPWQFIDDVQLMFNNAWLYNRKNTRVYKSCTKVLVFV